MEVYVRITKSGDSPFEVGKTTPLSVFIVIVEAILKAGGEMPIALYEEER